MSWSIWLYKACLTIIKPIGTQLMTFHGSQGYWIPRCDLFLSIWWIILSGINQAWFMHHRRLPILKGCSHSWLRKSDLPRMNGDVMLQWWPTSSSPLKTGSSERFVACFFQYIIWLSMRCTRLLTSWNVTREQKSLLKSRFSSLNDTLFISPMWTPTHHVGRVLRNILMSEELYPEYAAYFADLSFEELDELAASFKFENCVQRQGLNDAIKPKNWEFRYSLYSCSTYWKKIGDWRASILFVREMTPSSFESPSAFCYLLSHKPPPSRHTSIHYGVFCACRQRGTC